MKISKIKVKCRPWGHKFEAPFLSDFSYGQFIYSSQDGQVYRYLDGLNNKAWDLVQKIVKDIGKGIRDEGNVIQTILGHIADKDSGAEYYQNKKIICPICKRTAWHVYRDDAVGYVELPLMTFDRFGELNDKDKEREIKSLIK
jgi:hypothetical protein